ncbi:hypothetical protein MJG53_016690 [Ovis ammon polii x Ovis aries]|uniref:Uncharacterized protein n=2 Tax=Ovis TaxID=9935 RepID=A0A836CUS4_SHEEP|nr:hypothetical protein JEQ12_010957 [Ovis aries]KAI4561636.1 hypothetical protein MJG53_016690 [Ovis ammon polii x Ovis aries]
MESVSESSQQQKRKLVTHGLEDQKRCRSRAPEILQAVGSQHTLECGAARQQMSGGACRRELWDLQHGVPTPSGLKRIENIASKWKQDEPCFSIQHHLCEMAEEIRDGE